MVDIREQLLQARQENVRVQQALERARQEALSQRGIRTVGGRGGLLARQQQLSEIQKTEQVLAEREQAIQQVETQIGAQESVQVQQNRIRQALETYGKQGSFRGSLKDLTREERNYVKEVASKLSEQAERIGDYRAKLLEQGKIEPISADERVYLAQLKNTPGVFSSAITERAGIAPAPIIPPKVNQIPLDTTLSYQTTPTGNLPYQKRGTSVGGYQAPTKEYDSFSYRYGNLMTRARQAGINIDKRTVPFAEKVLTGPLTKVGLGPGTRINVPLGLVSVPLEVRQKEELKTSVPQARKFITTGAATTLFFELPVVGTATAGYFTYQGIKTARDATQGRTFSYADPTLEKKAQQNIFFNRILGGVEAGLATTYLGSKAVRSIKSIVTSTKTGVSGKVAEELNTLRSTENPEYYNRRLEIVNQAQRTLSKNRFEGWYSKFNKNFPTMPSRIAQESYIAISKNPYQKYLPSETRGVIGGIGEEFEPKFLSALLKRDAKSIGLTKVIKDSNKFIEGSEVSIIKSPSKQGVAEQLTLAEGSLFDIEKTVALAKVESRPDLYRISNEGALQFTKTGKQGTRALRVDYVLDTRKRPTYKTISYIEAPKKSRIGVLRTFKAIPGREIKDGAAFVYPSIRKTGEFRFALRKPTTNILKLEEGSLTRQQSEFVIRKVEGKQSRISQRAFIESLETGKTKKELIGEFRKGVTTTRGETIDVTLAKNEPRIIGTRLGTNKESFGLFIGGKQEKSIRASIFTAETQPAIRRGAFDIKMKIKSARAGRTPFVYETKEIPIGELKTISVADVKTLPSVVERNIRERPIKEVRLPSYVGGQGGLESMGAFANRGIALNVDIAEDILVRPNVKSIITPIEKRETITRQNEFITLKTDGESRVKLKTVIPTIEAPRPMERVRIDTGIKQDNAQRSASITISGLRLQQGQQLKQPPLNVTPQFPKTPRPTRPGKPPIRPPRIPRPIKRPGIRSNVIESITTKGVPSYDVIVGRGSKAQVIGKNLPYGRALQLGVRRNVADITASFKVVRTGVTTKRDIKFKVPSSFAPSKRELGRIVQRRETRLSARGEVADIMKARRKRQWF